MTPAAGCEVVPLWGGAKGALPFGTGRLEFYRSPRPGRRPTLVVVPGGGYGVVAPRESAPVGLRLRCAGFHVAVLYYRTKPCAFPGAYADLTRAIRLLRWNADAFMVNPRRIGLVGFSAGGHLAGLVGFAPDLYRDPDDDLLAHVLARPDRLALVYPLVRLTAPTHEESVRNFFGNAPAGPAQRARFDLDALVDGASPPLHLTHARDDEVVPIAPSLALLDRAERLGLATGTYIVARGGHGFGADPPAMGSRWPAPMIEWMDAM